jgi:uncharacterized protein YneF (UPF0154 family)
MKIILAIVLGFAVVAWGVVFIADEQMETYMEARSNSVE